MYSFPAVLFSWSDCKGKYFHLFHPGQVENVMNVTEIGLGQGEQKEGLGCWIHPKIKWTECFGIYLSN